MYGKRGDKFQYSLVPAPLTGEATLSPAMYGTLAEDELDTEAWIYFRESHSISFVHVPIFMTMPLQYIFKPRVLKLTALFICFRLLWLLEVMFTSM